MAEEKLQLPSEKDSNPIRPDPMFKEFKFMTIEVIDEFKGLSPEQRAEREKDWIELIKAQFDVLEVLNPETAAELRTKLVADLTPETLLAGLTSEKLATLSPEQRKKLIELLSQPDNQSEEEKQG